MTQQGTLHVRFDGQSMDIPIQDLDLGVNSSDQEVKYVVARYLEVPESKMQNYAVDREGENITLRPAAVFG